jgi:riboflavin kinase/FMN adenylyltransferase
MACRTGTLFDPVCMALRDGHPDEAARLLGRYWVVRGRVEHGDARGRTIGFPTANLHPEEGCPLAFGIYAVRISILRNNRIVERHDGVANFGIRPMYRTARPLLEIHLFDFDGDLYGRQLQAEFVAWLRPEAMFADLNALVVQIAADAAEARARLAGAPPLEVMEERQTVPV